MYNYNITKKRIAYFSMTEIYQDTNNIIVVTLPLSVAQLINVDLYYFWLLYNLKKKSFLYIK